MLCGKDLEGYVANKILNQKTWLLDTIAAYELFIATNHKFTDLTAARDDFNKTASKLRHSCFAFNPKYGMMCSSTLYVLKQCSDNEIQGISRY